MRATVTLPDTIDGRRVRARVEAGELTAFSAAFQALEEEWPAPPAEPAPPPPDRRSLSRPPSREGRLSRSGGTDASSTGRGLSDWPLWIARSTRTPLVDGIRVRPGAC